MKTLITKPIAVALALASVTVGGVAVAGGNDPEAANRIKYNDPKAVASPVATTRALDNASRGLPDYVARRFEEAGFAVKPGSGHHSASADGVVTAIADTTDGFIVMAMSGDGGKTINAGKSRPEDIALGHGVLITGGTAVGGGRSIVGAVVPDGVTSTTVDLIDGSSVTLPARNGFASGYVEGRVQAFHFTSGDGQEVGTALSSPEAFEIQ